MAKDKKKAKAPEPEVETKKSKKGAPEPETKKGKKAKAAEPEKGKKKSKGGDGEDFEDPSSGDQFVNKDHVGSLVLFNLYEFERDFKTSAGLADIVRGDVTVLTKPSGKRLVEPLEYENTIVFGKVLVSTLKAQVGKKAVLGRLEEGEAKKGQSAPYILKPANDEERVIARQYMRDHDPLK